MKLPPRNRPPVTAHLRFQERQEEFRGRSLSDVFTRIYRTNLWGSEESVSGIGSALSETAQLRTEIPALLRELRAETLLDIPCGDFAWMNSVSLGISEYIGADIVEDLVVANATRYGSATRRFIQRDLTRDPLPAADVVLCRDCLVHLSFAHIVAAFANLRRSGSVYLLTTTFLEHDSNEEIMDGDWRPLNLQRPPFALPPPEAVLIEGCMEERGAYADKALALWRVSSLAASAARAAAERDTCRTGD